VHREKLRKHSRKHCIFVIASEAKQSKTSRFLDCFGLNAWVPARRASLAITQKRIVFRVNAYKNKMYPLSSLCSLCQKESYVE
jgi:hypothetical protein